MKTPLTKGFCIAVFVKSCAGHWIKYYIHEYNPSSRYMDFSKYEIHRDRRFVFTTKVIARILAYKFIKFSLWNRSEAYTKIEKKY